jgi:nucleotide-binding universal stress UspA family protein
MLKLRRVLFPTDRSACAERAYVHAAFLARAHDAELHALAVRGSDTPPPAATSLLPLSWSDVAEQLRLPDDQPEGELPPDRVREVDLPGDSPAEGILRYAEEHEVDLIVMGTHGRQSAERLLAGSVAERVVREAPCPVLTVRQAGDGQIRRILVPIDFSERGQAAIPVANELAKLYGAEVELLFVIDEDTVPMAHVPLLGPVRVSPDEIQSRFRKLMADRVKTYRGEAAISGTVRIGHPARDIAEYAEGNADLIVMSTHGRTGLQRLFLGSVAEKVIRRAPCPVFTVKSFGHSLVEGTAPSGAA